MTSAVQPAAEKGHRAAVIASFLGWTLDAFDFFVVIFLIDTLTAHFKVPKSSIVLTLTATLATRPVDGSTSRASQKCSPTHTGAWDIPVR